MKKILFLGGLNPGGAEHQMVVLAMLLKKEGYDVTYLCSDSADFYQKILEESNVQIIKIKDSKIASVLKMSIPRSTIIVFNLIKKVRYDTVISFLGDWNFYNCVTAKLKSTKHKVITGIRNNRDEVFLWKREKFYNKFECYADYKVSNSDAAKNKFAKYYPSLASKLLTIYNIVDLPMIHTDYCVRRKNKVHIIVPASYRDVKNPMGLLKALTLMNKDERSRLQVDWYGSIKNGKACYDAMVSFIKENELNEVVFLFDATTDIANKVNEADMVGLFSSSEGLPNSICEGMMLGKPVVMTRVSDYDVLVDQTNGFLCDWDNPQSIKEALLKASRLSDEELLKMGECSKNKAESLFSKEVVLEQWKQII